MLQGFRRRLGSSGAGARPPYDRTQSPGKGSKARKAVREMNQIKSGKNGEMVTVKNDCGTRIYKCDENECYMVGNYCLPGCC